MALWTPADAPGGTLAAWYDPSDAASLTTSSGLISQVNDKSGNARHATAAGALRVPTGTIGSLGCFAPTGSQYLDCTMTAGTTNNVASVLLVWDPNNSLPFEVPFVTGVSGGAYPNAQLIMTITNGNFLVSGDDDRGGSLFNGTPDVGLQIAGCTQSLSAAALYQTGNSVATDATTISSRTTANRIRIGAYTNATLWTNSSIGEIVYCVGSVSSSLREQIEGYLAWKWDGGSAGTLVGKLPSGHPYKSAAPTSSTMLAPALFTNANSFHAATVARGAVAAIPPLLTNTSTTYSPSVSQGAALRPPLLTNANVLYPPAVAAGAVTLAGGLLSNASTVYGLTASAGLVTLSLGLLTNTTLAHAPAVTPISSDRTLLPGRFDNVSLVHAPILPGAARTLLPGILLNPSAIRSPAVANDNPPGTYPLAIGGRPRTVRGALAAGGAVAAGSIPSTGRVIAAALKGRP